MQVPRQWSNARGEAWDERSHLAGAASDRLANTSYQVAIEGSSYRVLLGPKEVTDPRPIT